MRAMTKLFILAATAALAACSQDNEVSTSPVEARITAGVSGPKSRAVDNKWNSDHIGVMVVGTAGTTMETKYKNVEYVTTSAATSAEFTPKTEGNGIFFEDSNEEFTFAAYAPYASSTDNSTLPGTDGVIAVNTSNQPTPAHREEIDYIYATGAKACKSSPTISFTNNTAAGGTDCSFNHKMARLILKVQTSNTDGFGNDNILELASYKLGGLVHEGTFDVTTGTATAGTASPVNDWMLRECTGTGVERTVTNNCVMSYDATAGVMTFTMILLPQTLANCLVFEVSPNDGQDQTYDNTTDIKPELLAGYSYTYTITVRKTGLHVNGSTIVEWNEGEDSTGDAFMR